MSRPRIVAPDSNVLAAIMAEPWAILPANLEQIVAIASRANVDIEALEAERGEPMKNTRAVTVRDGVASIPVRGPTFRYANVFTRVSGATSYQELATDLTAAVKNPDVQAVVLSIDSPGGQVNGNAETAAMIRAADAVKPVVAYISGAGASAAYLLASAARKVVVDPMALVGSIGTVMTARASEDDGSIQIVSSQSPKKRLDPTSAEGQASMQQTADAIAQVFVERVAEYRGVSVDQVLADFGQGDVLVGQAAVDAGLADEVGDYESVLAALRTPAKPSAIPARRSGTPAGVRASSNPVEETQIMDDKIPAAAGATPQPPATGAPAPAVAASPAAPAAPAAATSVVDLDAVRREAAAKERERYAGIAALRKPGNEKMVDACLADPQCSVEMAKARLYDHEREIAAARLNGARADEQRTPAPKATPATGGSEDSEDPRARAQAAVELHRSLNSKKRS